MNKRRVACIMTEEKHRKLNKVPEIISEHLKTLFASFGTRSGIKIGFAMSCLDS